MLQTYAHSVETRQYSFATPIIIAATPAPGARSLPYSPDAMDGYEKDNYMWPLTYDLKSMVGGDEPGDPSRQAGGAGGGSVASLSNVKICASSEREGFNINGDSVGEVQLVEAGTYPQLNAGVVHLYICKSTADQIAAEASIDKVTFVVSEIDGTGIPTTQIENYPPFEVQSADHFGGDTVKKVTATIISKSGQTVTTVSYLDLRGNGRRWRFRRHLQNACPTGLATAMADPWLDLSQLDRDTCRSSQDPNANYATTTVQRAILHSDVANHAYQNSDYSPYSGQQHGHISRNLQAAAVIHMTSGNRGELGKAAIPDAAADQIAALNNKINQIYQNYEKVVNKVIDRLGDAGENGGATQMGVQQLAEAFRSQEKGATSSKRLKTTTYVPSFNVAGLDLNRIQQAVDRETDGNKAAYADVLSPVNPATNQRYIRIYEPTMVRVLEDIEQLAAIGYTYQESVKMFPCSELSPELAAKSQLNNGINNQAATACCTGSMLDKGPGECGASLTDIKNFIKRNAQGNKDGGVYAATKFYQQQQEAMNSCPTACNTVQQDTNGNLLASLVKTATGTCVTAISGAQGCINLAANQQLNAGDIDCRGCISRFNNVAPKRFKADFGIGNGITQPDQQKGLRLGGMIDRIAKTVPEPTYRSRSIPGDPLVVDDTAICHTESSFSCPGEDSQYDAMVDAGLCSETQSVKIDEMCEDGPCDSDPSSALCQAAKDRCEVDPETGVKCMPNSENNPCDCQSAGSFDYYDAGTVAAVTFASLLVLAAAL